MASLAEVSSAPESTPSETGSTTTLVDSDSAPAPAVDVKKTDEDSSTNKGFVPKFLSAGPAEPYVKTRIFGVYELMEEVQSSWITKVPAWRVVESTKTFIQDWPFILRFIQECLASGSSVILLWIAFKFIMAFTPAISLYFSGRLMSVIQDVIENGKADQSAFYKAAGSVIVWRFVETLIDNEYSQNIQDPLQKRIEAHFNRHLLRINIRLDVPTSEDPLVRAKLKQIGPKYSQAQAWKILSGCVSVVTSSAGILSELYVLSDLLKSEEGGRLFALVAAIRPLLHLCGTGSTLPLVFYVHVINPAFQRLRKMKRLANSDTYRRHIIGDGLEDYVQDEYDKSCSALEGTRTGAAWEVIGEEPRLSPITFLTNTLGDMPLILFAMQAIRSSKKLPLKSLTLLSNSAADLGWRINNLQRELKELSDFNKVIRTLYEAIDIVNQIQDGALSYPGETSVEEGMKIEFRDVSFSYPRKDAAVLKDMSFVIQPGQLCVIVGENGCGKSSTVKLLSRLYDASKGSILIDDVPISSFKSKELRKAQAILYQDFVKYPTTIRENIGFGDVSHMGDMERIREAAAASGALEFIDKLPNGFETEIEAKSAEWSWLSHAKENGPLQTRIKALEEELNVSGGQWQRLAIARSFMRAQGNDAVRLMCYDEPSSALDPKAEFALFEKLRSDRGKKTLIFITHRFGHLTKHADLILYMKDGCILEKGTHTELLEQNGNYAHFYNVQAQAFA